MPVIRPVSDLLNKTPEIEEICIKERKPVFITKNGGSHLVVMSQQLFEEQQTLLDLYEKLDEAEEQSHAGAYRPFREVMSKLQSRIHAQMHN
jgi:PHD/YefM family antitoxin component YafN of YafNO toxin-antitoxin module